MIGPFEHPWLSGLFGDAEAAAIWSAEQQMAHMLAFEIAYTDALAHVGRVTQAEADRITTKMRAFTPDLEDLRKGTGRDGLAVPALVAQLRAAVGGDAKAVHTGTTSQDVMDTSLALTLRDFDGLLADRLARLQTAFAELAEQHGAQALMGRTRMQAALPITVADRVRTWSAPVARHMARLKEMGPATAQLQLGGAAGNRAALGADGDAIAAFMAEALGLSNPPTCWHTTRDGIADYAGLLSGISGTLGKFGQDICLMAQQGIDEVKLAEGGTSSAMPHKHNPIKAELLVTLARFNATQIAGVHHAMVHEQERSGSAWALEWMILPQMAQATARSLGAALDLCAEITAMGSAGEQ